MDKVMYIAYNITGLLLISSWAFLDFSMEYCVVGFLAQIYAEVKYGSVSESPLIERK